MKKKAITLVLTLVLTFSVSSVLAYGKSEKNNKGSLKGTASGQESLSGKGKEKTDNDQDFDEKSSTDQEKNAVDLKDDEKKSNLKKQFKAELNGKKKELQQEKAVLSQEKEDLEAKYEEFMTLGDIEGANAVLESIKNLDEKMKQLQSDIKEAINERFMVVKTMYSDEELSEFDNATGLIEQMYEDANVLDAGCVTVNNNIVKFDAPAYIKGGITVVPMRAIAEELDAEVFWDEETKTVKISKNDTIVEITVNSTTVYVNGVPTEISTPANVSCGRTYLPLRFLAEALDFNVNWDSENEIIDIVDEINTGNNVSTDTSEETE